MKLIINNDQLKLLENDFHLIEGHGFVKSGKSIITEGRMKEFLVGVIVNGFLAQIRVGAHNGTNALMIVAKLFPKARITGSYISA